MISQRDETLYVTEEEKRLKSYFVTQFDPSDHDKLFSAHIVRHGETFDFSHVHFADDVISPDLTGFCVNIGAPRETPQTSCFSVRW